MYKKLYIYAYVYGISYIHVMVILWRFCYPHLYLEETEFNTKKVTFTVKKLEAKRVTRLILHQGRVNLVSGV